MSVQSLGAALTLNIKNQSHEMSTFYNLRLLNTKQETLIMTCVI